MKKQTLYGGIIYIIIAIISLILVIWFDFRLEPLLCGAVGAFGAIGIRQIYKYIYWSKPENQGKYEKMARQEKIELNDERKIMIRHKSAYIVNFIMNLSFWVLVIIFSVCSLLEIGSSLTSVLMAVFSVLIIFQIVLGEIVYNFIERKC